MKSETRLSFKRMGRGVLSCCGFLTAAVVGWYLLGTSLESVWILLVGLEDISQLSLGLGTLFQIPLSSPRENVDGLLISALKEKMK